VSISINAISMEYGRGPRSKRVLNDVSMHIDDGEIVGYAGLNGAGKTTTMRISAGVISPLSGDVMINQISMKDQKLEASRHVAWIPEAPMLDPMENPEIYSMRLAVTSPMHAMRSEKNSQSAWKEYH